MNSTNSVLFVCMGNICRSPSAEAVFQAMIDEQDLGDQISCDSAGTIGFHAGQPADRRMRAAAEKRGYDLKSIARQVRPDDFASFDHIIAMDLDNLEGLRSIGHGMEGKAKLSLMCDYARKHDLREVPDPYYGGRQGFELVLDLLEDACAGLLDELKTS
jgi:protein-tyrosine phosphatase